MRLDRDPFPLIPNTRETNRAMVRIDVHEQLGSGETSDLITAICKIARHYRAA